MIIIKNGGNAIYGATLVTPSLVHRHLEKISKHHVNCKCTSSLTLERTTCGCITLFEEVHLYKYNNTLC